MKHKLFIEWAKTTLPNDLAPLFLLCLLYFTVNVGFDKVWPVLVFSVIWCTCSFLAWRYKTVTQQRRTADNSYEPASHDD